MSTPVIGFIGLGNMASSIIGGLRSSREYQDARLVGFDLFKDKGEALHRGFHLETLKDEEAVVRVSDVLVLAVKPQSMEGLLARIAPKAKETQLVVSIAAGKTLKYLQSHFGSKQPLVRVMPNMNARARASMTGIAFSDSVKEAHRSLAVSIFDAIGSVLVLDEEKMPAFGAVAGAGPAFAFAFIDALATAGVRAGLPREVAQQAACAMLMGSAKLVAESGEHPRALIDQVTSPGGTTIEGMHALSRLGFEHAVQEAVAAVIDKEKRMG